MSAQVNSLPIIGIPNLSSPSELKKHILEKGCYSQEENLRIYQKWFQQAPRYLFRAVNNKYHLTNLTLCDVGCSYGMNLAFVQPGSYGLEVEEYPVKFANSIGLRVERLNIYDDLSSLPKVEAVWCSAVLEHVNSPHIFLRKLHQLLKSNGIIVIFVPTIPLLPWLSRFPFLGKYLTGYLHEDHINAFTPETLKFFCEFAGFRTLEVSPFYPPPLNLFNHLSPVNKIIDGCVYVGQKINDWEYPKEATRRVANNEMGFTYVGNTGYPPISK